MCNFFKNTRKRKCTHVQEVLTAKRKSDKKEVAEPSNLWGVKNVLPENVEGEDDRTVELHVQNMKAQYAAHPYRRKMSIVDTGMAKTLTIRRNMIVSGELSLADVIDEFPFLAEGQQVKSYLLIIYLKYMKLYKNFLLFYNIFIFYCKIFKHQTMYIYRLDWFLQLYFLRYALNWDVHRYDIF